MLLHQVDLDQDRLILVRMSWVTIIRGRTAILREKKRKFVKKNHFFGEKKHFLT